VLFEYMVSNSSIDKACHRQGKPSRKHVNAK